MRHGRYETTPADSELSEVRRELERAAWRRGAVTESSQRAIVRDQALRMLQAEVNELHSACDPEQARRISRARALSEVVDEWDEWR